MFRTLATSALVISAFAMAPAAHAGTHWSIGISLPAPVVVAEPAPVYYAPPPPPRVVYVPAPRYVSQPVYVAPAPRVVYETGYWGGRRERCEERYEHRWDERRWEGRRWSDRRGNWDGDRDNGPYRGH